MEAEQANPYASPESNVEPEDSGGEVAENPHVLWRQLLGFLFWAGVFSVLFRGSGAVVVLLLGALTFADAWVSGIYKRPDRKSFLNISPMSWGVLMALLFVVAYPTYVLSRNRLRTIHGTNGFYIAATVLGGVIVAFVILAIVQNSGS